MHDGAWIAAADGGEKHPQRQGMRRTGILYSRVHRIHLVLTQVPVQAIHEGYSITPIWCMQWVRTRLQLIAETFSKSFGTEAMDRDTCNLNNNTRARR